MVADIIPVIAAITGQDENAVNSLFTEALAEARAANGGRLDTKAYTEAVMVVRAQLPFDLADLQAGWKAKEDLESTANLRTFGNTLPMPS